MDALTEKDCGCFFLARAPFNTFHVSRALDTLDKPSGASFQSGKNLQTECSGDTEST